LRGRAFVGNLDKRHATDHWGETVYEVPCTCARGRCDAIKDFQASAQSLLSESKKRMRDWLLCHSLHPIDVFGYCVTLEWSFLGPVLVAGQNGDKTGPRCNRLISSSPGSPLRKCLLCLDGPQWTVSTLWNTRVSIGEGAQEVQQRVDCLKQIDLTNNNQLVSIVSFSHLLIEPDAECSLDTAGVTAQIPERPQPYEISHIVIGWRGNPNLVRSERSV
jgi:hypothetical protein